MSSGSELNQRQILYKICKALRLIFLYGHESSIYNRIRQFLDREVKRNFADPATEFFDGRIIHDHILADRICDNRKVFVFRFSFHLVQKKKNFAPNRQIRLPFVLIQNADDFCCNQVVHPNGSLPQNIPFEQTGLRKSLSHIDR